jgi:hypothetical protein
MPSVTAADIVFYGSANMPENDTDTTGGALDATTKVTFTQLTANDSFDVVSDNAGDTTQVLTITGRLANGTIDTENFALNGVTTINGAKTFERLLKAVLDADTTGTVTISENSGSTTVATLEGTTDAPNSVAVRTVRRMFYDATAGAAGTADKLLYESFHIRNNNTTNALLSATIELTSDPSTSGIWDFELTGEQPHDISIANRTTEPNASGMLGADLTWNDASKSVASGDISELGGSYNSVQLFVRADLDSPMPAEKVALEFTVAGSTT